MFKGMLHLHMTVVTLFLLIYVIKTALLLLNKKETLQDFTRRVKVPEIVVNFLFLLTGFYLWANSGNLGMWLYVKVIVVLLSIPIAVIGFKKQNKALALLSLIMIIYAYGVAETKSVTFKKEAPAGTGPTEVSTDTQALGKSIYTQYCVSCHGEDGKLGLSGAKDLSISQLDSTGINTMVNEGKNAMTGFKTILSAEQVNAVSQYVKTLRK
jgi:mono/diheme cytochrome c family protein